MVDFPGEKGRLAMRARRGWCEMDSRRFTWVVESLTTWSGQVEDVSSNSVSQVSRKCL